MQAMEVEVDAKASPILMAEITHMVGMKNMESMSVVMRVDKAVVVVTEIIRHLMETILTLMEVVVNSSRVAIMEVSNRVATTMAISSSIALAGTEEVRMISKAPLSTLNNMQAALEIAPFSAALWEC